MAPFLPQVWLRLREPRGMTAEVRNMPSIQLEANLQQKTDVASFPSLDLCDHEAVDSFCGSKSRLSNECDSA